jgi:hypothetical protein
LPEELDLLIFLYEAGEGAIVQFIAKRIMVEMDYQEPATFISHAESLQNQGYVTYDGYHIAITEAGITFVEDNPPDGPSTP